MIISKTLLPLTLPHVPYGATGLPLLSGVIFFMTRKIKIEIGEKRNRLTVISEGIPTIRKRENNSLSQVRTVLCKCDCGEITTVNLSSFRSGATKSCGCLRDDLSHLNRRGTTHGFSYTKIYGVWHSMKNRCYAENGKNFKQWGGRGICVCQYWKDSFVNFYNDVGECPKKGLSLDRINNEGNYSCGHCEECIKNGWIKNVKWSTQKEQSINRTTSVIIEINKERKTIVDWCKFYGIGRTVFYNRVKKGWSAEKALSTPKTYKP